MEYFDMCKMSMNLRQNAAGETYETCIFPSTKCDFYWRASIVSIAANGGSSLFPGTERIMTLLKGSETFLESMDRFNHTLKPLQPFSLAVDLVVKARLTAGQMLMDLNIMTRLDVRKVKVRIVERAFIAFDLRGGVVSAINGMWQLGDKLLTTDQDVRRLGGRHTPRLLQPQGKLLFSEINWLAGHSSD